MEATAAGASVDAGGNGSGRTGGGGREEVRSGEGGTYP